MKLNCTLFIFSYMKKPNTLNNDISSSFGRIQTSKTLLFSSQITTYIHFPNYPIHHHPQHRLRLHLSPKYRRTLESMTTSLSTFGLFRNPLSLSVNFHAQLYTSNSSTSRRLGSHFSPTRRSRDFFFFWPASPEACDFSSNHKTR